MPRKLTAKTLDALTAKLPATRVEIADADGNGLYLVGGPRDGWNWKCRFRWPPNRSGQQVKLALGPYGHGDGLLSLKQAREAAAAAQADLARGIDPRIADRQKRGDDRLVENVLDTFLEAHVAKRNRASTARETKRFLDLYVRPKWKGRLITDIRRVDIAAVVREVAATKPVSAVKLRANLSKLFAWTAEQGLIETSPFTNIAVPAPVVRRDRVLSRGELHLLLGAVDQLPVPFAGFIQMLIYTGQRRSEVAGMRWEEIDIGAGLWTIPKARSKNAQAHAVPLAPAVVAILQKQRNWQADSFGGADCPFVFTSDGMNNISGFSYIKREIDVAIAYTIAGQDIINIEVAPWTLHDLRRSASSHMGELGVQPWVIESILNHLSGFKGGIAGTYNRSMMLADRRAALDTWAAHLADIRVEAPGKVVRLRA